MENDFYFDDRDVTETVEWPPNNCCPACLSAGWRFTFDSLTTWKIQTCTVCDGRGVIDEKH